MRRTSEWFRMMEKRRETAEHNGYTAGTDGRGRAANPYVGKEWSEKLHAAWLRGWRKGNRARAPKQEELGL
jgi:ribosome modulation factor